MNEGMATKLRKMKIFFTPHALEMGTLPTRSSLVDVQCLVNYKRAVYRYP